MCLREPSAWTLCTGWSRYRYTRNTLQLTAIHCNTCSSHCKPLLSWDGQGIVIHLAESGRAVLRIFRVYSRWVEGLSCGALSWDSWSRGIDSTAATHCNTLQHTALHRTVAQCITLQLTAMHCATLHHTEMPCNTMQHPATSCSTLDTLQHAATHCNTLQHTATRCNILTSSHTTDRQSTTRSTTRFHGASLLRQSTRYWVFWRTSSSSTVFRAVQVNSAKMCGIELFDVTRCKTLQHTATYCNTRRRG